MKNVDEGYTGTLFALRKSYLHSSLEFKDNFRYNKSRVLSPKPYISIKHKQKGYIRNSLAAHSLALPPRASLRGVTSTIILPVLAPWYRLTNPWGAASSPPLIICSLRLILPCASQVPRSCSAAGYFFAKSKTMKPFIVTR